MQPGCHGHGQTMLWTPCLRASLPRSAPARMGGWGERGLLDGALSLFPANSNASHAAAHLCFMVFAALWKLLRMDGVQLVGLLEIRPMLQKGKLGLQMGQ